MHRYFSYPIFIGKVLSILIFFFLTWWLQDLPISESSCLWASWAECPRPCPLAGTHTFNLHLDAQQCDFCPQHPAESGRSFSSFKLPDPGALFSLHFPYTLWISFLIFSPAELLLHGSPFFCPSNCISQILFLTTFPPHSSLSA